MQAFICLKIRLNVEWFLIKSITFIFLQKFRVISLLYISLLDSPMKIMYDDFAHSFRKEISFMNIAICDDESCYRTALNATVHRWAEMSCHTDISVFPFSSSEELLSRWEQGLHIDMLFLDIQIPSELSGIELAKIVRKKDSDMAIVFTTNYDEYVFEGYTVCALRYLKKPVSDSDLFPCLDIAYRQTLSRQKDSLTLPSKNQYEVVRFQDILYVESNLHYLHFYLQNSSFPLKIRTKLSDYIHRFPQDLFIQCHCSYVVNLSCIRRYAKDSVILSTGKSIPVSKAFFPKLHTAIQSYYGEV